MLIFCLTQNGGSLAEKLETLWFNENPFLFGNDILLAAIYVDPMYRVSLTESKQNKAKATLFNIVIQMTELDKETENPV